ncbi:tetratricopeptide repeat protein [Mesorhizobium sp. J428]|uniref:tetratricopeptide repeat protein n=1 Tax=Mesorhizobium sp. J428 TaxID=2898440 RepID=UPI002150DC6F|nr:sel1 repeat family protein [Mesorhizobium sp. J428]
MRIQGSIRVGAVAAGLLLAGMGSALALDPASTGSAPLSNPWEALRDGFDKYRSGHKGEAMEAYRYAAEKGQLGAQWKLARMYADGDGVTQNDYEAFKFYSQIVNQGVEHGSVEAAYVSDALVAIGGYVRKGIPGSPVKADPVLAQEYYRDAATNYRNPTAQFELGRMFLNGEGVKASIKQAGRWLQLAAEKGHAGAQATLGNLLYQRGKVVRGLAMLTAAMERADPSDRQWIGGMQEEAFALATEADRRTAIALAQDMLGNAK